MATIISPDFKSKKEAPFNEALFLHLAHDAGLKSVAEIDAMRILVQQSIAQEMKALQDIPSNAVEFISR